MLPTFEKESTLTLQRLDEFAKKNDEPLREDIRPFAREFSAAMPDVEAIAPDFRNFIADIGPLSDAGRKGLPASTKLFDEIRPLIEQFDPFLRSFNPFLDQLGVHKRDFMSFVLNGTMVTQGAGLVGDTPVHYLRGEPTISPEALAAYPRRLPSNRNNPYAGPDDFRLPQRKSYPTWDTAMCDKGGLPALPPAGDIMDQDMLDLIYRYAYLDGNVVSPPCITHAPFTAQGTTSLIPANPA